MSAVDAPKPVEETPAAVPAAESVVAAEPVAATEAAPEAPAAAAETAEPAAPTETTEAAAAAAAEAPKEEAKEEEVTPASEGTLGYKGPGLVKSFRFTKRFFYFSDDAVDAKNLLQYLGSEKSSTEAKRTAAWATQTGKGLLFLTKRAEDKATPAGIFNLSEVSDINKEGANEFSFKTHGHKHVFQASSATERNSWVAALTAKSTEAEAEKETITTSESYKAELEKLSKPAGIAGVVKAAATPEKDAKEGEAAVEDKKEEKKEEKKDDKKSRSQSRKRASIFGTILGKKEAKEEAKEETPVAPEATTAETTPAAETAAPVETTEAAAEPAAEPVAVETAAETPAEDKKEEPKVAPKTKRASIFGNFFNKVSSPSKEKTEEEVAPVASTAPQLDNPVDEAAAKPIEPETVTEAPAVEAAVASSSETPAAETAEKKEETTPELKDKRRTSLFGTLGKKVKPESTSDGEGKKTANKLGGLFRKPSKAVKSEEDKKEVAPAEPIAEAEDKPEPIAKDDAPVETAAADKAEETAVVPEPVNVAPTAAPVQAAA